MKRGSSCLTLEADDRKVMLELYLEKSDRKLEKAESLQSIAPEESVSASYYAAFHVVKALFLQYGLETSKKRGHRSVISLFNDKFVHEGIFPNELRMFLGQLETDRNKGDYSITERLTREHAAVALSKARRINSELKRHIRERQQEANRKITEQMQDTQEMAPGTQAREQERKRTQGCGGGLAL